MLYPQVNAIAANSRAWAKLDDKQRAILRQAASDARSRMLQRWDERREARAFCKAGGTIVNASNAQVAALRQKGAALIAVFSRDARTAGLMKEIRGLPVGASDRVALCRPTKPLPAPTIGGATTTLMPAGTYRRVLGVADMRDAGADENMININAGTHTLVVDGAKGSETGKNPNHSFTCAYRYVVAGAFVRVDPDPNSECSGDPWYITWRLDHRDLILTWHDGHRRPQRDWNRLFNGRWERVG